MSNQLVEEHEKPTLRQLYRRRTKPTTGRAPKDEDKDQIEKEGADKDSNKCGLVLHPSGTDHNDNLPTTPCQLPQHSTAVKLISSK